MIYENNLDSKTIEFTKPWVFMTRDKIHYWGYALPRLFNDDSDGKKLVSLSAFWTPVKCDALDVWLDSNELVFARCLKVNGIVDWIASLRNRTGDRSKYSEIEAERLQLQADEWRRHVFMDKINTAEKRRLKRPNMSWMVLDLCMRGLISRPNPFITPPELEQRFSGDY